MNRRHIIHNQPFIEYCYRRLSACSEEDLGKLDHAERKYFASPEALHRFVKLASKEQLDLMLTKIGVEWVQVYGPDEAAIADCIFSTFDTYRFPEKRKDVTERMSEDKVFATGSREAMMSLHMAAQNAHTKTYNMSQRAEELIKIGKTFNAMPTYAEHMDEAYLAYDKMNRILKLQLASFGWVRDHIGINIEELRVLSVLFDRRKTGLDYAAISSDGGTDNKWAKMKKTIKTLSDKRLIISDLPKGTMKMPKTNCYFLISEKGIEKMIKYRNYIHDLYKAEKWK